MPYVNPIPMIDMGKTFDMRLSMQFDELLPVEDAIKQTAEYIAAQSPETIAKWLHCTNIKAVYPDQLTEKERQAIGIDINGKPTGKKGACKPC